jgi:hypothetical protein
MRNNRRRDKSSCAHEIPLLDSNGFHISHIGIREARLGIHDGTYRPLYAAYRFGTPINQREITGVQLTSNRVMSFRPCVPLTRGEADAAVGLHGESRTMRLNEFHKALRVQRIRDEQNRIVAEEDHIERAKAKLAFYPAEVDRKAVRTGPLPVLEEMQQFASLTS